MGSIGRPIWMSTGIYDVDVMPAYVQSLAAQIKQVCAGVTSCPTSCIRCNDFRPGVACSKFGLEWLMRLSGIAELVGHARKFCPLHLTQDLILPNSQS